MNPEELLGGLRALLEARNESEARQVLQEHPELLDEEVDLLLEQLASQARQDGDANAAKLFAQWRELLSTARSSGATTYSPDESELSRILQELSRPAQLADMPRRIQLCQQALELVPPENAQLWATLHIELGNCLAQSPQGDCANNIEQSILHFEQALKVYTEKDFPEDWAAIQNNLAIVYKNRIDGIMAENIEQAILHFGAGIKCQDRGGLPRRLGHDPEQSSQRLHEADQRGQG